MADCQKRLELILSEFYRMGFNEAQANKLLNQSLNGIKWCQMTERQKKLVIEDLEDKLFNILRFVKHLQRTKCFNGRCEH
ncbi:hypothetical protein [Desulfofalx alkaliphila]|uniref:hypothetical protein n=1 Tax=Desulfofalx alkaliphila TaxID=105483 RepID=UPI0004E18529|nr:hypothetical protein [Desulfofalx alkaliphila]